MDKTENKLALMEIYRNEWMHRDNAFIAMFWHFITISLVVTFLPELVSRLGLDQDTLEHLPYWIFPVCGIITACFGMYLTLGEARRIEAIDLTFKNIMYTLPADYQMLKLDSLIINGERCPLKTAVRNSITKMVLKRLNDVFCVAMFLVIILLSVIKIIVWQ